MISIKMNVSPLMVNEYHVFVASPSDMDVERKAVRKFFNEYNQSTARLWGVRFEVVDSESYATIGVGRPQEIITRQTLETFKDSLALVIGLMGQRFGSPPCCVRRKGLIVISLRLRFNCFFVKLRLHGEQIHGLGAR